MDNKTARQDLETVIRAEDLALGSMRKLRAIQDWLRVKAAPAQDGGEAVAPFVLGNSYQTLSGEWVRFVKVHNEGSSYETMVDESGVNRYTNRAGDMGRVTASPVDYPGNVPPLYTRPSASVPDMTSRVINDCCWTFVETMPHHLPAPVFNDLKPALYAAIKEYHEKVFTTTPQPADNWRNAKSDPPEMGVPVVGWHPEWICPDFNPRGTRECFRFGDGTEWNSAHWFDEQDCYTTHEGAPELWLPFPTPVTEGAEW